MSLKSLPVASTTTFMLFSENKWNMLERTCFCTFFHVPTRGQLSLSPTIWLVEWIVAPKGQGSYTVHRDPVNITAALICNGRQFVSPIVRRGGGSRGTGGVVCVCICLCAWKRTPCSNDQREAVPLKYSPVKGASANCVLVRVFEQHHEKLVSVSSGSGSDYPPPPPPPPPP